MRTRLAFLLIAPLGLAAQAPPAAGPAIKWRGAVWASAAASDRQTPDGTLFLRSVDAGEGQLALDGLQLGADVALPEGFGLKFTILGGQTAKVLNAMTFVSGTTPSETGSLAWPEAMVTWTGGSETLKVGRMYTAMGMEVLDATQDTPASRGLLFTYAIPCAQLGLNWRHAFSASWSSDVWVFNGEDRVQDNNRGKTAGAGLTYNHGGAADRFATLMAFSGAEQDGTGAAAIPGAEGRKRTRLSFAGQWVWGPATLQWEAEHGREALPDGPKATWTGLGAIGKYAFNDRWSAYLRLETLRDDTGLRLGADPSVARALPGGPAPDLRANSGSLGLERRWHATFTRLELRRDSLDRDVKDRDGKAFRDATSLTWSLGTSF
ncbi:outer membrane beta-barrel protein [Mesoterricola silvestris]|uniref:Porin n=1 Tax=Mesoterricola silvestris TaxID=2927979 RepID=A0AA48K7Q3_9BACT|nr:outer membrane beta-barrel protein [Mesoterricola silvestris]BDU71391.1 hypothetical protein METEAL_05650 [Mesoterricola silvestris]